MAEKVTAKNCMSLPSGRHGIEKGLHLRVMPSGDRYWVLRFTLNGKRCDWNLGCPPAITLAMAKQLADNARVLIAQGIDPRVTPEAAPEKPTFAVFSREAIDNFRLVRKWKNAKHVEQWFSTVETYANPFFGSKAIDKVTRDDVLAALKPIWETKTETAVRLRGRIEAIFEFARAKGYIDGMNPGAWKGNLDAFLPHETKFHFEKHHRALSFDKMQDVFPILFQREGVGFRAISFGILTATRAQEFLGVTWGEIDLKARTWTIPAERMKAGIEHRVPLSDQAMQILESVRPDNPAPEDLVFLSPRTLRRMAIDSPRKMLRDVTGEDYTMHGCRSTFRDWCEENLVHSSLSERALAHTPDSKVVRAYQRSDLLEQRRPLMQQWADAILSKA